MGFTARREHHVPTGGGSADARGGEWQSGASGDGGARLLGKGHVELVLNYLDTQNYLLCELDDTGFKSIE
jgi:hypothetical protein